MNTSVVAMIVLLCACGSGGTSLEGTIECGTYTCNSGELCRTLYYGVDAEQDQGPLVTCVEAGCEVSDCEGQSCAPCVVDACCAGCRMSLMDRQLTCGAP